MTGIFAIAVWLLTGLAGGVWNSIAARRHCYRLYPSVCRMTDKLDSDYWSLSAPLGPLSPILGFMSFGKDMLK